MAKSSNKKPVFSRVHDRVPSKAERKVLSNGVVPPSNPDSTTTVNTFTFTSQHDYIIVVPSSTHQALLTNVTLRHTNHNTNPQARRMDGLRILLLVSLGLGFLLTLCAAVVLAMFAWRHYRAVPNQPAQQGQQGFVLRRM